MARESGTPDDWFDDLLGTHLIDAKALRADDVDAFWDARVEKLLKLIADTMGKSPVRLERQSRGWGGVAVAPTAEEIAKLENRTMTIGELLAMFAVSRRSYETVPQITLALETAGLRTFPSFAPAAWMPNPLCAIGLDSRHESCLTAAGTTTATTATAAKCRSVSCHRWRYVSATCIRACRPPRLFRVRQ